MQIQEVTVNLGWFGCG